MKDVNVRNRVDIILKNNKRLFEMNIKASFCNVKNMTAIS